ncbi:MAG: carboxymuconolactone decarboxylase family protein, partial [Phycisphaerales bacterium JB065]
DQDMAYISTINENEASGDLGALYTKYARPAGEGATAVDDILKVHSVNPPAIEAHVGLAVSALLAESPVSKAERHIIGVVVALVNGCEYCLNHHANALEKALPDDRKGIVEAFATDGDTDGLTDREEAIAKYVQKLTIDPGGMTGGDVAALKGAGLTEREVHDVVHAAAYCAYASRIALGLGASIEADVQAGIELG